MTGQVDENVDAVSINFPGDFSVGGLIETEKIIGSFFEVTGVGIVLSSVVGIDISGETLAVMEFKKRAVPMTVVRRIEGRAPITIDISSADLEEMWY